MNLSVVIPTSRRRESLRDVLQSCLGQELTGHDCEVIVVSNPPDSRIEELVRSLPTSSQGPRLRLLESRELGANRARNLGLAAAGGDIVYFLDDDCVLPRPQYLQELIAAHIEQPELAGIGGKYVNPQGCSWACRFYNSLVEAWLCSNQTEGGGQLVLPGGNASYKKIVFEDGIRFDETLIYGGTETEFNHRVIEGGHQLELQDNLSVIHNFSGTWRSLARRAWRQGRGKGCNPHQAAIRTRKDSRARLWSLRTAAQPRFFFVPLLFFYYIVVQAGYLSAKACRQ